MTKTEPKTFHTLSAALLHDPEARYYRVRDDAGTAWYLAAASAQQAMYDVAKSIGMTAELCTVKAKNLALIEALRPPKS